MLIKTKLVSSGSLLGVVLVVISLFVSWVFSGLSHSFGEVVSASQSSFASAEQSAQGAQESSQKLIAINNQMLGVVDNMQRANQRTQLISKKVTEIAGSINELVATIEELSADVSDPEALEILQEVSDEVGDIGERLKREALVNILETSERMGEFSTLLTGESAKVAEVTSFVGEQVTISNSTRDSSSAIQTQAETALQQINQYQVAIVALLVLLAVVILAAVFLLVRAIVVPISNTVSLMQDIAEGEGDLTQRLSVSGKDEMTLIAAAFNTFVDKMQHVITDVLQSAREMHRASDATFEAMKKGEDAIENQKEEIEQIAAAINEMSATSQEVASNALAAATSTNEVNDHAAMGKEVVVSAKGSVTSLVEAVEGAVKVIETLNDRSENINAVVGVIKSIAEQTNLLALNAAIEAARAGEQGRGFAVVADEVRALAAKAAHSTNEIESLVEEVQALTRESVQVMQTSRSYSSNALSGSESTDSAFTSIIDSIRTIDTMNAQIASAAEEQTAVTEEINQRIVQINEHSQRTSVEVSKTVATCAELNRISDMLGRQLSQFKV